MEVGLVSGEVIVGSEGKVKEDGDIGTRGAGVACVGDIGKSYSCHVPGISAIGNSHVAVRVTP